MAMMAATPSMGMASMEEDLKVFLLILLRPSF
jgi:hypothetical protein